MLDHILLPLDGSSLAERVLPHAISLSEAFNSKLTLLRVVYQEKDADQNRIINPIDWNMRKSEADAYLRIVQNRLKELDIDSEIQIVEGHPAQEIIEFAKHANVDMIVLSSHGKSGPSSWNINSTVQKVLLRAYMPLMIIRAYQETAEDMKGLVYKRLLLPLDGSTRAECILPLAKSISEKQSSKIFLTHIVEEPKLPRQTPLGEEVQSLVDELREINIKEAETYFNNIKDQFQQENVEVIIESSRQPTVALHNIIDREKIELVLLSAHGYSGENRWPYGKIALNFISYGTTPLIIIQDLSDNEIAKSMAEKYAEQTKGH
jgi:nucleotide-binding universal stress UspA family protein